MSDVLQKEVKLLVDLFFKRVVLVDRDLQIISKDVELVDVVDHEDYTEYLYSKDRQTVCIVIGLEHQVYEVHVLHDFYDHDEYLDTTRLLSKIYYLDDNKTDTMKRY
jgi:hypothetical protein